MERHIGIWEKEGQKGKPDVGELIIDGNSIEFYSRHGKEPFPCAYVGHVEFVQYKVFISGSSEHSTRCSLESCSCHRVVSVLRQGTPFQERANIDGITEVRFEIPELIDWIGVKTVDWDAPNDRIIAGEIQADPIILSQAGPRIELVFASKTINNSIENWDPCSLTIESRPAIEIKYEESADYDTLIADIRCISQFFGLLIGYVSGVTNVFLSFDYQESAAQLYINSDFSYNYSTYHPGIRPRTYLYLLEENIERYYTAWRSFYFNDEYSFIRQMYFSVNGQRKQFAEDILLQYIRFLEGYDLRISQDEETADRIRQATKLSAKEIRNLLFSEDGRPLFEDAIREAIPNYVINNDHEKDISQWIATGYIGRTSLSSRLQRLSANNFDLIAQNAEDIERLGMPDLKLPEERAKTATKDYLKQLSDTRNYFSHFKADKSGLLTYPQINDSINVLNALILSILYGRMGFENDMIRKTLMWDDELSFQTQYLREEGEKPFNHHMQYYKSLAEKGQAIDQNNPDNSSTNPQSKPEITHSFILKKRYVLEKLKSLLKKIKREIDC